MAQEAQPTNFIESGANLVGAPLDVAAAYEQAKAWAQFAAQTGRVGQNGAAPHPLDFLHDGAINDNEKIAWALSPETKPFDVFFELVGRPDIFLVDRLWRHRPGFHAEVNELLVNSEAQTDGRRYIGLSEMHALVKTLAISNLSTAEVCLKRDADASIFSHCSYDLSHSPEFFHLAWPLRDSDDSLKYVTVDCAAQDTVFDSFLAGNLQELGQYLFCVPGKTADNRVENSDPLIKYLSPGKLTRVIERFEREDLELAPFLKGISGQFEPKRIHDLYSELACRCDDFHLALSVSDLSQLAPYLRLREQDLGDLEGLISMRPARIRYFGSSHPSYTELAQKAVAMDGLSLQHVYLNRLDIPTQLQLVTSAIIQTPDAIVFVPKYLTETLEKIWPTPAAPQS